MRASDLQQLELVGHDTATGFPVFGGHRMMVTGMAPLARLSQDLHQMVG